MNKLVLLLLLGSCWLQCYGRQPIRPLGNSIPFMVYYESRYRGICVGFLVSRLAVLTAAVCVTNPKFPLPHDNRPLNVVAGSAYRHIRRGMRIRVAKIVLPKLPDVPGDRGYLLQRSVALLILSKKLPDILMEIPMRGIEVDVLGEDMLKLQDECILMGWHFLYNGEPVWPGNKFLLQRNLRYQYLNLVPKAEYCDTLRLKFETAMDELGFSGLFSKKDLLCLRDPDRTAQPCHGMYGSPLICRSGRVVGMLLAPDAQWTNCTGYSNMIHSLNTDRTKDFFSCVDELFQPEYRLDWERLKHARSAEFNEEEYIIKNMYDGVVTDLGSSNTDYE